MARSDGATPGGGSDPDKSQSHPDKIRSASLLALLAAAAVFTALGIEGETLRRVVRNDPYGTAWPIAFLVIGLSAPLLYIAFKEAWAPFLEAFRKIPWKKGNPGHVFRGALRAVAMYFLALLIFLPGLLVVVGLGWLVFGGARSLHEREMPMLSATASKASEGTVNIKYKAVAPSLRSDETVLLRVVAFTSEVEGDDLARLCLTGEVIRPNPEDMNSDLKVRRILHWGESGPTKAGEATVTADVNASTSEFRYVCAYSRLFNVEGERSRQDQKPYYAWSVTDLLNPLDETDTSPSSTPTAASPPSTAPTPNEASGADPSCPPESDVR